MGKPPRKTAKAKPKSLPPRTKVQAARQGPRRFLERAWQAITSLPLWTDVLGVIAAALALYEIFYATIPDIQPDPAISPSWVDLPLKAKNNSRFFDMTNVTVACVVENVTWKTPILPPYQSFRMRGKGVEARPKDVAETIEAGRTITFPCNIAENIVATPFGAADVIPISLIRLKIRISYRILNFPRSETSSSFTWRSVSGGFQWLEGDISDKP
jgi:hypothetical protein